MLRTDAGTVVLSLIDVGRDNPSSISAGTNSGMTTRCVLRSFSFYDAQHSSQPSGKVHHRCRQRFFVSFAAHNSVVLVDVPRPPQIVWAALPPCDQADAKAKFVLSPLNI
jgi:hypothetical protein